jgi:hypothetical protein
VGIPPRTRPPRFDRIDLGFWLGGFALGTAGCILGAFPPYRHPVAVTVSVLWWGIVMGCFGASIGALLGLWMGRTPPSPSQASDGAGKRGNGADSPARLAGRSRV